MKKIIFIALFVGILSLSAFAQKTKVINIRLNPGDRQGELLGAAKSVGITVFVVQVKRGYCFEAAAKIESNNSKMSGQYYTKRADGTIDDDSVTQGSGVFSNQFDGCADTDKDEAFYFKITEKPAAKFSFSILVKARRIN